MVKLAAQKRLLAVLLNRALWHHNGYLIIEADEVNIVDDRGHTLPAKVVGYDHASGLGLIRPVAPFDAPPLALGDSTKLAEMDPVLVVNHGGRTEATVAYVVSRRP